MVGVVGLGLKPVDARCEWGVWVVGDDGVSG